MEFVYEDILSGEFGNNLREVDARGKTLDEKISSESKVGNNLYTSLDLNSHQAAAWWEFKSRLVYKLLPTFDSEEIFSSNVFPLASTSLRLLPNSPLKISS